MPWAAAFSYAAIAAVLLAFASGSAFAKNLCDRPEEAPQAMFDRLTKAEKLAETFRDKSYVAISDRATGTVWTFTIAGHPAHPSVVCRRPVPVGDRLELEMNVSCNAPEAACQKLLREFQDLNQRMIEAMKKQVK
jgi:hypothetical protein